MAYVLDGAVILIFVLSIYIGYRRGFMRSVLKLVGCILAAVLAGVVSKALANQVFDSMIAPSVTTAIEQRVDSGSIKDAKQELQEAVDSLPDVVNKLLSMYGMGSAQEILDKVGNSASGGVKQLTASIVQQVIRPIVVPGLQMLLYVLAFAVLALLASIVANAIGRAFRLPVIRQCDGVLGAVIGALEGVIWVFLAVTVIQLSTSYSTPGAWVNRKDVDNSLIVSRLEEVNPISKAVSKVMQNITVGSGK